MSDINTSLSTALSTAAARNLADTTKTNAQMVGITPRWLLRVLPWVQVNGGVYRVNRRLTYAVGDGKINFTNVGARVQIIPDELKELALLRDFDDADSLIDLAGRFTQRDLRPGDTIVEAGQAADSLVVIAHGRVQKLGTSPYGEPLLLDVLSDGDHAGEQPLLAEGAWKFSLKATTTCIVLSLSRRAFEEVAARTPALHAHVERYRARAGRPQDRHGQAAIAIESGHRGEAHLPGTFVDYEQRPREYELSIAQTLLRIHTRVADLYNGPHRQVDEQLRLTVEALRERQEHEMINNRDFGLLHSVDLQQRIATRSGPPTPDDIDELISRRRKSKYILAHPRAIAAFGRECSRRGVYPPTVDVMGSQMISWRGVPFLPCDKLPISSSGTTSILCMRVGEDDQGVVGLHQTGIPDEIEPSLSARFTGIDERAVLSYLVTAYYSAAVLIPDAIGMLEDVELGK